ncbi:MAG: phosphoserine aminotransferase [Alphaproteobacteria bacterium]|nr:phosphoserine aminotransferase [Alphaproteobacteria bacterium]
MRNLCFCSGPCAKRPGWKAPETKLLGRSHRSTDGLNLIKETVKLQREILQIPDDYLIAITPASSTGAMEMLLWNFIRDNGTDILNCCVFSNHWARDIIHEIKAKNVNLVSAEFPYQSDTKSINHSHDVVFCISSTTSGTAYYDLNWISDNRQGITICDASSGAFVMTMNWSKLDATAFSWQKGLGGEAGFGVIVLSPRAVNRLLTYQPQRGIPRVFRMLNDDKLNQAFFEGSTINTPSMLCIQECYDNLKWAKNGGGLTYLIRRVEENYQAVYRWISQQDMFRFLVPDEFRAHHIACLDLTDDGYQALSSPQKREFLRKILEKSEQKQYGYDFLGHALEKPHIRIWCGPTIELSDLNFFLSKLPELYAEVRAEYDFC